MAKRAAAKAMLEELVSTGMIDNRDRHATGSHESFHVSGYEGGGGQWPATPGLSEATGSRESLGVTWNVGGGGQWPAVQGSSEAVGAGQMMFRSLGPM